MSTTRNVYVCGGAGCNNTGNPNCQFVPGNITGMYLIPKGKTFTKTELETFDTVLKEFSETDTPGDRLYPFLPIAGMENASTDQVTSDDTYGGVNFVRDGKIAFDFKFRLGHCSWKKMRSFNAEHSSWDALFIDPTNNVIWGTSAGTGMKGFSLNMLNIKQPFFNDGADSYNFNIMVQLQEISEMETDAIVQFGSDVRVMDIVTGLIDITLTEADPISAGRLVIKAYGACGGEDLYDMFATELSSAPLWIATNTATGEVIAITSVTDTPASKGWAVQLDVADPNYPAVGEFVTIKLDTVSALDAAGIIGYESCESQFEVFA